MLTAEEANRVYMEQLKSRRDIGEMNESGDYPYLPLTKNKKFRAIARESAAIMREQREALKSYGDDPAAWPRITREEIEDSPGLGDIDGSFIRLWAWHRTQIISLVNSRAL